MRVETTERMVGEMIAGLIKRLRDLFQTLSQESLTRIITIDDPEWVLLSRVVMWISLFSVLGMLIIFPYINYTTYYLYSVYVPSQFYLPFFTVVVILILLATASGIPVFLYERKISKREKYQSRKE